MGFQQQQQQPMGFQQQQQPQMQQQQQQPQAPQMPNMGSLLSVGMAAAASGGDFNSAMGSALFKEGGNVVAQTGLAGWGPYLLSSLQGQFNVSHGFVLRKLLLLLCPFVQQSQGTPSNGTFSSDGDNTPMRKSTESVEFLKVDINEPDLYIPLMSYFTYCLVYCIQR